MENEAKIHRKWSKKHNLNTHTSFTFEEATKRKVGKKTANNKQNRKKMEKKAKMEWPHEPKM